MDRLHDIYEDVRGYLTEALLEWQLSVKDSPPAHIFTFLAGAFAAMVASVIRSFI